MNSITKICITCNKEKPISDFHFRTDTNKYRNECNDCNTLFHKKHYQKNAEKAKAWAREYSKTYYPTVVDKKKQYALENKEKIQSRMSLYQKEYYEKNKENIKNKNKIWESNNPNKRAAITGRRRAREVKAEGSFTPQEWEDLCNKYDNKCLCCGKYDEKLTVDHVIPLISGGTNYITNIQPLCKSCNCRKRTKTIDYR